jgi:hypothetical protein
MPCIIRQRRNPGLTQCQLLFMAYWRDHGTNRYYQEPVTDTTVQAVNKDSSVRHVSRLEIRSRTIVWT